MTIADLDELQKLYTERADSLDASSYRVPELIKLAREALELRDVLDGGILRALDLKRQLRKSEEEIRQLQGK